MDMCKLHMQQDLVQILPSPGEACESCRSTCCPKEILSVATPLPAVAAMQAKAAPRLMYLTSQVGPWGCCCKLYFSCAALLLTSAGRL